MIYRSKDFVIRDKAKFSYLIFFFLVFQFFSVDLNNIKIKSDSIEFLKNSNQINFNDNVEINSDYINIEASSAIYDQKKIYIFDWKPATITSNKDDNDFSGTADKILFFDDE